MHPLISNYIKTNAILKSAVMGANGWNVTIVDKELLLGPQSFIYVWDQKTKWLWMCSTTIEKFQEIANKAAASNSKFQSDIQMAVGSIIRECAEESAQTKYPEWESQLGLLAISYAGITKTWKAAEGMPYGGHFIVLRYAGRIPVHSTLRPACIHPAADNAPLSIESIIETLEQIHSHDRNTHPEWFN